MILKDKTAAIYRAGDAPRERVDAIDRVVFVQGGVLCGR
jgi:hypothetical protein